jgi:esterase/lipase superfamily enzyme
MPKYWMISNRNATATDLGRNRSEALSFYTADSGTLKNFKNWQPCTAAAFRAALIAAADAFPLIPETEHEKQKHVTVFVHGYNNDWRDAAARYQQITDDLYAGPKSLGICVLFTWPSNGATAHYLADREDARASGPALAKVFNTLFEHSLLMQQKAADGTALCKAKVSVIAHSMGNWVFQNALFYTWERNNKPLLVSLVNQCIMVAADVDNDLFGNGEALSDNRSEGMANLCYRITALFSGRDSVLGVSAGLKHFGKRRLGRSGLDRSPAFLAPDNVWDYDCSALFPAKERDIHSAYFWTPKTLGVIRAILQGYDRNIIAGG